MKARSKWQQGRAFTTVRPETREARREELLPNRGRQPARPWRNGALGPPGHRGRGAGTGRQEPRVVAVLCLPAVRGSGGERPSPRPHAHPQALRKVHGSQQGSAGVGAPCPCAPPHPELKHTFPEAPTSPMSPVDVCTGRPGARPQAAVSQTWAFQSPSPHPPCPTLTSGQTARPLVSWNTRGHPWQGEGAGAAFPRHPFEPSCPFPPHVRCNLATQNRWALATEPSRLGYLS